MISGWVEIHPNEIESKEAFKTYLHIKNTDDDYKNKKSLHDQTRVLLYNNRPTKNHSQIEWLEWLYFYKLGIQIEDEF